MKRIFKPILTAFTLAVFSQTSNAQEAESIIENKTFYYEQGINVSQFIKQYASLNSASVANLPYLITGNIGYKRFGLRYGANYVIDNVSTFTPADPFSSNTTSIDEKQKSSTGYFRLGVFHSKNFGKRWRALYGLDYAMTMGTTSSDSKTTSSNNGNFNTFSSETSANSSSKLNLMGGGPFLSVQFFVNKNCSIGTELSYYYMFGDNKETTKSSNTTTQSQNGVVISVTNTSSNFTTTEKFQNATVFAPTSIFFNFRF